ncbi:RNA recognition motif domain [Ostreococcus tauri]|uniref:RNA recognition motif domain n=1 Tax=Ostreococcus tauri TaxID=70448 RepID=A0A096P7P1_OSTTA|nr:RNA recognition motif domain [Ostreococcus tauri]CEG00195.1 RNA recognition motif domain [Ostreococcus tauri]|eukprot:XP_022840245.1 RNA recognition motif domain [Ostreococcus tauri]
MAWRRAAPATARAADGRAVGTSVDGRRGRAFEDERVKDARDEARARGVYAAPSAAEAEKKANATHPRTYDDDGRVRRYRYFDQFDMGLEFGAGVAGYFFVVRALAFLFFAAFAINLPAMYVNYTSTYYASEYEAVPSKGFGRAVVDAVNATSPNPTFHSWYVNWHWANPMSASLGTVAPDTVPQRAWLLAEPSAKMLRWSSSKIDFIRLSVGLDIASTVMILLATPIMYVWLVNMERRVERGTATLRDYSVLVTRLPSDATEEEVRCFFAMRYGDVGAVTVVKSECMHVRALRRRTRLLEDYDEAEAALLAAGNRGGDARKVRIEEAIINVDRKLARKKARTRAKTSCAFVTFETECSKIDCLLTNQRSWISYIFAFPRKSRFRGKIRFEVREAPDPEDVYYENLNLSDRWWRHPLTGIACAAVVVTCYGLLKLLVMDKEKRYANADMYPQTLASDVGIVVAQTAPPNGLFETHGNQFKAACETRLDQCGVAFSKYKTHVGLPWGSPLYVFYEYPNATARDREYAQLDFVRDLTECADDVERCPSGQATLQNCYACHCASLRYGLPQSIVKAYSKSIRYSCERYVNLGPGEYYNWLWTAFVISLLNIVPSLLSPVLISLERLRTRSKAKMLATKMKFMVKYINVAVIYCLLNADLQRAGKYLPLLKQMFGLSGEYEDFTNAWYNDVGLVIFFSIMMSATMRFIERLLDDIFTRFKRTFVASYIHTQRKLDHVFEGPKFDTGSKAGDVCYIVMAAMTYSSGMPLLYLVASMFFVIVSLYDYRLLLKVCKTPDRTRTLLAKTIVEVLFVSVFVHCFVGLWMFSIHWTPDLLHPGKGFEDSAVNDRQALEQSVGGLMLHPLHDNSALMATVADTGTATAYFHAYRTSTVGSVNETTVINSPPLIPLRYKERPFSEAGVPFLGLQFAVWGCGCLFIVGSYIFHCTTKRKKVANSWKQLPNFHVAILTGLLVGSETYAPEEQAEYKFIFPRKQQVFELERDGLHEDGPERGDSAISREVLEVDAFDDRVVARSDGYDPTKEYEGGAPWTRKNSKRQSSLYAGDEAHAKRGSRGTNQRDGGRYGVPIVDIRALGAGNDFDHRENDSYLVAESADAEELEYSGSDNEGTLADDASTERSASEYGEDEDDGAQNDVRRPSWLR